MLDATKWLKAKRGFTLIEMLIVVALIIIIAGIALPRFLGVTEKGRGAEASAELSTLDTAVTSYLTFNLSSGALPELQTAISTVLSGATLTGCGGTCPKADPIIVPNYNTAGGYDDTFIPGKTTTYQYKRDGRFFVVSSTGPDGANDITGINSSGDLTGAIDDDIFRTNGTGKV